MQAQVTEDGLDLLVCVSQTPLKLKSRYDCASRDPDLSELQDRVCVALDIQQGGMLFNNIV